jgi:hypothetical protein
MLQTDTLNKGMEHWWWLDGVNTGKMALFTDNVFNENKHWVEN